MCTCVYVSVKHLWFHNFWIINLIVMKFLIVYLKFYVQNILVSEQQVDAVSCTALHVRVLYESWIRTKLHSTQVAARSASAICMFY